MTIPFGGKPDVLVLGAGAAGLMCAMQAARRGRKVLVLERSNKPGKKILMSGGGRCNFTNMYVEPSRFLSGNPHFCKSALSRYTQWDFIELVDARGIAWHEKTLGQLFCDTSAKEIVAMLRGLMDKAHVDLRLQSSLGDITKTDGGFTMTLTTPDASTKITAGHLVIASGGKSIPKMGLGSNRYL